MSVTIKGIRLHNWRCFKGNQELELEPKVYSITARAENDPDRSNWLGKSSIIEAVVFALTGTIRKSEKADSWITDGEKEGGVDLELSDGTLISRFRVRGKSTKLVVEYNGQNYDGVTHELAGADAQAHIDETYIDQATLEKTSLFSQKQTDQFIKMMPSKRTEIVNGWLELDSLVDAEDIGRKQLNELVTQESRLQSKLKDTEGGASVASLKAESKERAAEVQRTKEALEQTTTVQGALREWNRSKANHGHYLVALKASSQRKKKLPNVERFRKRNTDAEVDYRAATVDMQGAAEVARGEFDGNCPVAEFKCPARRQINDRTKLNQERLLTLRKTRGQLAEVKTTVYHELSRVTAELEEAKKYNGSIAAAKSKVPTLKEDYEFIQSNPKPPLESIAENAQQDYAFAVRNHTLAVQAVKTAETRAEFETEALKTISKLTTQIVLCRQGIAVLKKARRFISEQALDSMERESNSAMADATIDLQVTVSWESELGKLATSCDECGTSFPSSQRIKTCVQCGADRPKAFKQELVIELSDESGGADDLAGFWFQLSAGAWLGRQFSMDWSVLLIDEVFAYLDRAHRRALSQQLPTILKRRFGVEQAFVVAHDDEVSEATAGRIVIVSDGTHSTVSVHG